MKHRGRTQKTKRKLNRKKYKFATNGSEHTESQKKSGNWLGLQDKMKKKMLLFA